VGNLSVAAIGARDYAVVQGYALLMAIVYLVVNWAVGLLQRLIDPRIGKGAL
jgi:ABC-type dipeptide/oligopeptide/nickel transport system permease component